MIPITPGMIKGGAVFMFLSAVFIWGCRVQKQMDKAKINKLIDRNKQYVEIIDTFQDNVDTLDTAIKEQNAAIDELGEETERRVMSLRSAHESANERLRANYDAAISRSKDETAELRERMADLSVAEACHEAWVEVSK